MKTTEGAVGVCSPRNTLGVRGACQSFGMWTRMNDKWVNYSYGFAQTKQVGQCIVEAFLVHGRTIGIHGFIKFTMAQI